MGAESDGPFRSQARIEQVRWEGLSRRESEIHFDKQAGKLLRSPFTFHRTGQSGLEIFGTAAAHRADCGRDHINPLDEDRFGGSRVRPAHHSQREIQAGRPTWGAWVLYGLGTERQDLPALRRAQ